eukprot:CAMPEP_0198731348 /NCGR_PEP_ID=MMETSP1475-20131203/29260_1 /TAXON_ID= ORGANISM="Unidentified sp., Strain CCMP1999" /NCGR_SAMPLE_ID=MMETSP1475 /ASSEMBLY_ACC=CAM_ASM_001111 /LENGTH=459 /DNA_ID=CAMNT_0044494305 /DNA_START=208 /DNA_END=1588 /DNA_ORIENTATION=+
MAYGRVDVFAGDTVHDAGAAAGPCDGKHHVSAEAEHVVRRGGGIFFLDVALLAQAAVDPIVDSVYVRRFGRRKSWIVPLQLALGLVLVYISKWIDCYLPYEECATQGPRPQARSIYFITFWFLVLVLLSATQDIAVDGWALEILPKRYRAMTSTCQTIGLNGGFFLSFTILLSLTSREFTDRWLPHLDDPLITISGYIKAIGIVSCVVALIILLIPEPPPSEEMSAVSVYRKLFEAVKERRSLLAVLLIHKIGFVANDVATGLFLMDKGLRREDFALAALFEFPLQIALGIMVSNWARKTDPTRPWRVGQKLKLFFCFGMNLYIYMVLRSGQSVRDSVTAILALTTLSGLGGAVMFVSQGSLFASISDSTIGGTYQTLLNTVSNFGGTWPKFIVLRMIDYMNIDHCDSAKNCVRVRDGYFPVAFGSLVIGAILYAVVVRSWTRKISPSKDSTPSKTKAA